MPGLFPNVFPIGFVAKRGFVNQKELVSQNCSIIICLHSLMRVATRSETEFLNCSSTNKSFKLSSVITLETIHQRFKCIEIFHANSTYVCFSHFFQDLNFCLAYVYLANLTHQLYVQTAKRNAFFFVYPFVLCGLICYVLFCSMFCSPL